MRCILFLATSSLLCALGQALTTNDDRTRQEIVFERDIRPILAGKCGACHGEKKQRSGLRFDDQASALAGGYSGEPAVLPFDSAASELIRRIKSIDEDERMPPDGERLSAEEIGLLERWIDAGASWGANENTSAGGSGLDHWAYVAPERPPLPVFPEDADAAWTQNPIDAFILERLLKEGLRPSEPADRTTLIRRLSLDLTGLPPSPAEVDAFLADDRSDAYERLVDRLLASPHFGERWGRAWLDLARYSDSNGGGLDNERSVWPYRDWVIDAFNADMPFDQFTIEQLAGDLLDAPSRAQLIATGFHRNTMVQEEGGADDEEYRIEAVKNRVDTTGTVWLGSTLICAQCHDHKYDPFTLRDYSRLYAVFNQTQDGGRALAPVLPIPTADEAAEMRRIDGELAKLDAVLSTPTPALEREQAAWEAVFLEERSSWSVLEPLSVEASGGAELSVEPDLSILASGPNPEMSAYTITAQTDLENISAIRLELLWDERIENHGPGRGHKGNFVLTEFRVAAVPADASAEAKADLDAHQVDIDDAKADWVPPRLGIYQTRDGDDQTGWGVNGRTRADHEAIYYFTEPVGDERGSHLTIELDHGFGSSMTIGRFRLSVTNAESKLLPIPREFDLEQAARLVPSDRTEEERLALQAHFLSVAESLAPVREERARLAASKPVPAKTLVMRAVKKPRETRIHLLGNFLQKGAVVEPGVPEFLPQPPQPPETDDEFTRLELARWLVDENNPLTARVVVNRWWQRFFGTGLVNTENDFGTRGALPSHPELLDWLAVEFMESGWGIKAMLRRMVTSNTYRQSSDPRDELEDHPGGEELLARQTRLRLEAESIRDSALVASGLLDRTIGGPSVYPPLPEFASVRTFEKDWPESQGSDRFRRTLYTWHWRTSPHPFLTTFDVPDATTSCTRRASANNALQALVMANDPMIFEIAQGLAERILSEGGTTDEERIVTAFRWCVGRAPSASEREQLERFLDQQRASFRADPADAVEAAPAGYREGENATEAAAWTALARVLFNLDEFITRT